MASKRTLLTLWVFVCTGALTLLVGTTSAVAIPKKSPPGLSARRRLARVERQASSPSILRRRVLNARPLSMYYYYDDTRGFESLQAHSPGITVLAPQCFWIDKEGFIHGALPPRVVKATKDSRLAVMPLLFNQGFDRATATAMLHSAKAQERAVSYMAYLARRDNAVGFQIDLENIDPADQQLFTHFVKRAATRLRRDGRLLSVAVTPRFSDAAPGTHAPGQMAAGEWSAALDYRALGRVADFLTLMTYDHSGRTGPPGPVAGYAWVKRAVDYAVRRVPRGKLLLGIPFYGREWTDGGDNRPSRSLAYQDVRALLDRSEISSEWDARWRSPWFSYSEGAARRTVWYEDNRSLREKLVLMRQYRLRGFAAWRLGEESPEFWTLAMGGKNGHIAASIPQPRSFTSVKRRLKPRTHRNVQFTSEVAPSLQAPRIPSGR